MWWASGLLAVLLVFGALASAPVYALHGATGAHDPSTIVKRDGVYHTWATGNQIYHLTSTDLVNWTVAPPVFAAGTWPSWINTYVTGFAGFFWAPECVFRNGKYYLYYSCSTGQRPCAIGLATSTDLVNWTDQGMVVFSDNSTAYGSIDPAVFTDATGRLWMTFGSHLTGIWTIELDPATGKRLNTTATNLAGSGPASEHEAPYMMQHEGYYYLFYNRGTCCAGTTSTYYVQMGRSISPTGPFIDRNGVPLLDGGGTNFLVRENNYYGPGHVGVYSENGINLLSYHYYDATKNGAPTLAVGRLTWDAAGWPAATQNWLPAGTYTVSSASNGKGWAAATCSTITGQALVQATATGQSCQQWRFTPQGSGTYTITNALSNLNVDVTECGEAAGTPLSLQAPSTENCQTFWVDRAADGTLVLASIYGNRLIGAPNAATTDGTALSLLNYSPGTAGQHWSITAVATPSATRRTQETRIQLYPNPTSDGNFTLELPAGTSATVTVADISGRVVYQQKLTGGSREIRAGLHTGAYVVQIQTANGLTTRKLITF